MIILARVTETSREKILLAMMDTVPWKSKFAQVIRLKVICSDKNLKLRILILLKKCLLDFRFIDSYDCSNTNSFHTTRTTSFTIMNSRGKSTHSVFCGGICLIMQTYWTKSRTMPWIWRKECLENRNWTQASSEMEFQSTWWIFLGFVTTHLTTSKWIWPSEKSTKNTLRRLWQSLKISPIKISVILAAWQQKIGPISR